MPSLVSLSMVNCFGLASWILAASAPVTRKNTPRSQGLMIPTNQPETNCVSLSGWPILTNQGVAWPNVPLMFRKMTIETRITLSWSRKKNLFVSFFTVPDCVCDKA